MSRGAASISVSFHVLSFRRRPFLAPATTPGLGRSQPVVKVQLHSAGDASPLHPTALKNARWGPRPLTALLLPQIFPILHPTVHRTHGGGPAQRSSRRPAGVPTARTVRRGVVQRGASPPSVRRWTFTTGC